MDNFQYKIAIVTFINNEGIQSVADILVDINSTKQETRQGFEVANELIGAVVDVKFANEA